MASLTAQLQESAFSKVLACLVLGGYTLGKESLMYKLRDVLVITEEQYMSIRGEIEAQRRSGSLSLSAAKAAPAAPKQSVPKPLHKNGHQLQTRPTARSAAELQPAPSAPRPRAAVSVQPSKPGQKPAKRKRPRPVELDSDTDAAVSPIAQVAAPRAPAELDPLIGVKVERWWGGEYGWCPGVVSDFRSSSGMHCIVYDMNKREETFEWFDIQNSEPEDCRVGKERIDLSELAKAPTLPKTPAPRALVSGVGPSSSKFHQRP